MPSLTPNLWFDSEGEEAAAFYTSIFPNSSIGAITRYDAGNPSEKPAGSAMTVEFVLDGQPVVAINGGPQFSFSEAISLEVRCADQAEVDHYWEKLGEGGEPGPCGWLKDRFGLSWQVVPQDMYDLLHDQETDPGRVTRVMDAMYQMGKLDVAALRAAADAPTPTPAP